MKGIHIRFVNFSVSLENWEVFPYILAVEGFTMSVKILFKILARVSIALAVLCSLFAITVSYAGPTNGLTLSSIGSHIGTSVSNIARILSNVALIAGIGFILAAFFKFHQHKLNPTQVPLSQGITLLLIGAGLTLFPVMIPTAKNAVVGSSASVSQLTGTGINNLIGTGT